MMAKNRDVVLAEPADIIKPNGLQHSVFIKQDALKFGDVRRLEDTVTKVPVLYLICRMQIDVAHNF